MPPLIANLRHRPEIDGLRAIAVLSVVLYHGGLGFPGGFVGVDVFFVISGYLITSLIIADLQEGKFTFSGFWERRARRIIPALAVMVIASLVVGWFLLLPADYAALGRSASFQAFFAANIHFWLNTGYFAGAADEMPLLHTWSLAVEEQFYLLVPLLFYVLFRFPAFRRRSTLIGVIGILVFVSLGMAVYGVACHPSAAFYLLPSRAWELALGSCVALLPVVLLPGMVRELLTGVGLGGVLIPCWVYTKATAFPGLAAVPPCLGTALFIWASSNASGSVAGDEPFSSRVLSTRPVVFIGLISYSLYLWHWPFLALSKAWALGPLSLGYRLGMIAVGTGFAILSWRFVEVPFRKRAVCGTKGSVLAFAGAAISVVCLSGALIAVGQGIPRRLPAKAVAYAQAREDTGFNHEMKAKDALAGHFPVIGRQDSNAPISLLVWGDSHAMAAMPAFDALLKERGLSGRQATASATPPILGVGWESQYTKAEEVNRFNKAVLDYILSKKIPDVVLIGFWGHYVEEAGEESLCLALGRTVDRLERSGTRPWLMLQVPSHGVDVPRALARHAAFGYDLSQISSLEAQNSGICENAQLANCALSRHVGLIDPRSAFVDSATGLPIYLCGNRPVYRDRHHLSASGARLVLLPFLRQAFPLGMAGANPVQNRLPGDFSSK